MDVSDIIPSPAAPIDTQLMVTDPLHRQLIRARHERTAHVTLEWLVGHIRNANTRDNYARSLREWSKFLEDRGIDLEAATPFHVAAFIERDRRAPATVKLRLAAIRGAYKRLHEAGVIQENPANRVRGPVLNRTHGVTAALSRDDAARLLRSIGGTSDRDLRDRAIIGTMLYTWARVGSIAALDLEDLVIDQGVRCIRFRQVKRGREHMVPMHSRLTQTLDAYLSARGQWAGPLFTRTIPHTSRPTYALSRARMPAKMIQHMVTRRGKRAGLEQHVHPHMLRATSITNYLANGGSLLTASKIAAHRNIRTTMLYDRTGDELRLSEIERVNI